MTSWNSEKNTVVSRKETSEAKKKNLKRWKSIGELTPAYGQGERNNAESYTV